MTEWTFAFVDLAGFTALTEAHGDEDAAEMASRFASLARDALGEGDRLVKSIGDAVMLSSAAPQAALALVGRLLERLDAEANFPVPRVGLHHGPAVERDGDFFGAAVNLAARVAAQAYGGQVLATEPVAEQARAAGATVVDLGDFDLKNVGERVRLFEIHVGPRVHGGAVDPVCRMRIERDDAAGRLRYEGADFWFCSLGCAASFASAPERYARGT